MQQDRDRRAANPQHFREIQRAYEVRNRDKRNADRRANRAKNPHSYRAYSVQYRKDNPEKVKAAYERWCAANPGKVDELRRRYDARKLNAVIGDTKEVQEFYEFVKAAKFIRCHWCGKNVLRKKRVVDHVMPLSKGGAHATLNLCCSCRSCNSRKGAKLPEVFSGQFELFVTT